MAVSRLQPSVSPAHLGDSVIKQSQVWINVQAKFFDLSTVRNLVPFGLLCTRGGRSCVPAKLRGVTYGPEEITDPMEAPAGDLFWEELVLRPSEWWDNRGCKTVPDYQDIKHSATEIFLKSEKRETDVASYRYGSDPANEQPERLVGYGSSVEVATRSEPCALAQLSKAVEELGFLVQRGCQIDDDVFCSVLKRCIAHKDLVLGSRVHVLAVKSGHGSNTFLANRVICMYASYGKLEKAMQVFLRVAEPNRYIWSSIIQAHMRHGHACEAIKLYQQMRQSTVKPDNHIFVAALKACASAKDLSFGRVVHADIVESVNSPDMFVCNSLVDMYAKCGSLEHARKVFDELPTRDVVTWTTMISGYALHGFGKEALALYASMKQEGITAANHVTFVSLLQACASVGALHVGKELHTEIEERGLESDVVVGNCLVDMYCKCGSLKVAREVFDSLPTRDVVTWNSMIAGYAQHGFAQEALTLHASMQQEGITLESRVTFLCLLQACSRVGALKQGRQVHAEIKARGLEADVVLINSLVDMYAKCGSLEDARRVFDSFSSRDVVTWNAMIAGYAQHGLGREALCLFSLMQQEGSTTGNHVTLVCLLQACATIGALHEGKGLHQEILERGLGADLTIGNCLVDMYSKCGSLHDARKVFDNLLTKNVSTWNAMIAGYAQQGLGSEALTLYGDMHQDSTILPNETTFASVLKACAIIKALSQGKLLHAEIRQRALESDVVVGTCLVDMYVKCGSLDGAQRVFADLPSKNVLTWTAMIAGYAQHGFGDEALSLYGLMQLEGITPGDAVTLVCLLQACGNVACLEKGKEMHAQIPLMVLEANDTSVVNALIDMYGKCGSMVDAQHVFDASTTRDVVTWSALIGGYARQGESALVFGLFDMMREGGTQPDSVIFLSVLTVCNHVGLVDKGKKYFLTMRSDFSIIATLEHYSCMVDLLGRAGQLDEAMQMVRSMPCQPDGVVWRCILGACQKWSNVELGRQAFECAVGLDKNDAAAYVMMSNIYAAADKHEMAKKIQAIRMKVQARKKPGQSWWTDVHGIPHQFVVGDKDHPEWQHIDGRLEDLFIKMRVAAYVPTLEDLPNDEEAYYGHSENLEDTRMNNLNE